jgi:hypothetical protein
MADVAWVSLFANNTDIMVELACDAVISGTEEEKQSFRNAVKEHGDGRPVADDLVPKVWFVWRQKHDQRKPRTGRLPDLALAGFTLVSERLADVLGKFDLGRSRLMPVDVLMQDRQTRLPGHYFVLNFDSLKDAFLPGQSPGLKNLMQSSRRWMPASTTKDDVIALSPAAATGPDLWWNPNFHSAMFLSDRLVQALRAAKLDKHFRLVRCRIVSPDE